MYNPKNWYWAVGADTTQVWSSAAAAYVAVDDADYLAWLEENLPTHNASEAELKAVFAEQYPAGWPGIVIAEQAQAALDKSDITIIRCVEHSVAIPSDWVDYRAALRAIVASPAGTTTLPARPSFPSGS